MQNLPVFFAGACKRRPGFPDVSWLICSLICSQMDDSSYRWRLIIAATSALPRAPTACSTTLPPLKTISVGMLMMP